VAVGYSGEGAARRRRGERELARIRADIGMVFQLFNLFPHLTARENVMLGLRKVRRLGRGEARDISDRRLVRVGLAEKRESLPYELSGGQPQRVGIARAVAMNPKVLLLDEITLALDPELVGEVLNVVRELVADGMTMILVMHELSFARDVSARVVFMDRAQVAVEGTPREVFSGQPREACAVFSPASRCATE
jgi:polar amino acid transport system ATP-binding protein